MLITGIRHRLKIEVDTQRTDIFKVYLMHFFQMFSFLGVIFPVLIAIDYFSNYVEKDESIVNKYYVVVSSTQVDYFIYTESYRFQSAPEFYEKTNIGDNVTFLLTPIFKVYTDVFCKVEDAFLYTPLSHIYQWSLVIAVTTLVLSLMVLKKIFSKNIDYSDILLNIGIINSLLCIILIIGVIFQKLY